MQGSIPILLPALVALSICVVLGLLAFLAGRFRPAPSLEHGRAVFRYRFLLRSFVFFAAAFLPTAVTFLVLLLPPDRLGPLIIGGAYLFAAMVCLPSVWESVWYYVEIDANQITHRSAWRGPRSIRWDEISTVTYSGFNMWFMIRFENDEKIRIPIFVGNLKEFLLRMEQHLPAEALRQARKGYEKIGRAFPALLNDPVLEARPPR